MACDVVPLSAFQSTNLNSKIDTFTDVQARILRNLGCPNVKIEATEDMINEYISQACELFTKFAGFTQELLIFRSDMYASTLLGVRLDHLFTLAANMKEIDPSGHVMEYMDTHYAVMLPIDKVVFSDTPLSLSFTQNMKRGDIIDVFDKGLGIYQISLRGTRPIDVNLEGETFDDVLSLCLSLELSLYVEKTEAAQSISLNGTPLSGGTNRIHRLFDYDLMDYRKVCNVVDYEEGSSLGVNTLFSIEQSLAQQTYFSYAMGNYGFDLVSWHIVQEWMETRQKVLATRKSWTFDPRTQYLRIFPKPKDFSYGVLTAYVERPLKDILKEPWVQQYLLALTKIAVAHVRGKIQGLSLFGGGTVNYQDLMSQGIEEKKTLEEKLFTGATPGFGDSTPINFIIS